MSRQQQQQQEPDNTGHTKAPVGERGLGMRDQADRALQVALPPIETFLITSRSRPQWVLANVCVVLSV